MYSGYGITFDSAGSWSFDNDTARNVIVFGVDNCSSSHAENRENNFLVLGEGPTLRINGRFGSSEKRFRIDFSNAYADFCLNLHYNAKNSFFFFLVEKKSLSLKPKIKMLTFQHNFVLEF